MAKASNGTKGATAVDTHVGQKIRGRRMFLRMTQTEVADAVGITFQQIQNTREGRTALGHHVCKR
jgi:transcriptional regulator with XRE-family HTH domain